MTTLPDDTLLVCFIGAPDSEPHPRVLVWRSADSLEEVPLAPDSRRMLAVLAAPRIELPGHLSRAAADLQLAAALAASLPQLSPRELRERLHYSRSQEWRVRRALATELADRGLGDRLVEETRDRIGLRGATTDAAALYAATRDGRADDAALLVRRIGGERAERLALRPPPAWDGRATRHVEEALAAALSHRPAAAAVPSSAPALAAGRPLPVVVRGRDRSGARRRTTRRIAAALLVVACAATPAWLLLTSSEPRPRALREAVAGPWPEDAIGAVANLSRAIPFDPGETSARMGDVLLLRQRFRVGTATGAAREPLAASLSYMRDLANRVHLGAAVAGADPGTSSSVTLTGVDVGLRIAPVPGTTRLLDVDGSPLRRLPDLGLDREVPLEGLRRGRVYFVSTRLRVAGLPDGVRGEFGNGGGSCDDGASTRPPVKLRPGDVVRCLLPVDNWGPRSLRRVTVRVRQRNGGDQISLEGTIRSPEALPARDTINGDILDLAREARGWRAAYVPGSARFSDGVERRRVAGNPLRRHVEIGELAPTPEIGFDFDAGGRLTFDVRIAGRVSRRG